MASEASVVSAILRVNHAGEYGAVRIYRAQRAVARWRCRDLLPFLDQTLVHERAHAETFRVLMIPRKTRSCGALPLWGIGGSALGFGTALLGRRAIMICTEAVERTVHAHLDVQLKYLGNDDRELSEAISHIRDQEAGHQAFAHDRIGRRTAAVRALDGLVAAMTGLLIWCSTYGALTRMRRQLG